MHLMVVDDHAELLDLVERALSRDGHVLRCAKSLAEARSLLGEHSPDLLILDLALPDGTGIDFCKELRSQGARLPILLLTAHGEVPQRVAGLDAGADDFLAKPFAMAELRARVRALSRRGSVERSMLLRWDAVTLDFAARRATRDEQEIPLTAREWALIEFLASRLGRVVARAEILDSVWGEQNEQVSASLDVLIGRLRRKLALDALRTVRGAGYVLERA